MTGRDHWTESLECPKCRKTGIVKLSQANGRAFHEGDQDVRVDLVPVGFKVVFTEFKARQILDEYPAAQILFLLPLR
jgi:hypothetical protein